MDFDEHNERVARIVTILVDESLDSGASLEAILVLLAAVVSTSVLMLRAYDPRNPVPLEPVFEEARSRLGQLALSVISNARLH